MLEKEEGAPSFPAGETSLLPGRARAQAAPAIAPHGFDAVKQGTLRGDLTWNMPCVSLASLPGSLLSSATQSPNRVLHRAAADEVLTDGRALFAKHFLRM